MGRLLHDHHLRGAAGHRPDALRGGPDRRRRARGRSRSRIKVPLVAPGADADPGLRARSAPCSSSTSRRSCGRSPPAPSRPDFTPNMYAYQQAFSLRATSTTARRSPSRSASSSSSACTPSCSSPASGGASSHERPHQRPAPPPAATPPPAADRPRLPGHLLPRPVLVGHRQQHQGRRRACSAAATPCGSPTRSTTSATCSSSSPTTAASTCAGSRNSTLYAFAGGVGATILAVLAGYGFAKYRFARPALQSSRSCSAR